MDDLRLIHTWSGPSVSTDDEKVDQERWEHIVQVCKDRIDEAGRALSGKSDVPFARGLMTDEV